MTEPKMVTIEEGTTRGTWIDADGRTFAVVCQKGQRPYVCIYPQGRDRRPDTKDLPYALSFDDAGDLQLQIPGGHNVKDVTIIPVSEIATKLAKLKQIEDLFKPEATYG